MLRNVIEAIYRFSRQLPLKYFHSMHILGEKAEALELHQTSLEILREEQEQQQILANRVATLEKQLKQCSQEMNSKLAEAEKQRVDDVWAIVKASQAQQASNPTASAGDGGLLSLVGDSPVAQSVALLRAQELEKELEGFVRSDEELRAQNEELKKKVAQLDFQVSVLQLKSQLGRSAPATTGVVAHTKAEANEDTADGATAAGNVPEATSIALDDLDSGFGTGLDGCLRSLESLWDSLGTSPPERVGEVQLLVAASKELCDGAVAAAAKRQQDLTAEISLVSDCVCVSTIMCVCVRIIL